VQARLRRARGPTELQHGADLRELFSNLPVARAVVRLEGEITGLERSADPAIV
jgi:hypothetical protein